MKQILFIALLAIAAMSGKAQDTTYLDNAGRTVKSLQLADYYRIVKPDADGRKAKSLEYYKSGKLKSECTLIDNGAEKANWVIDGFYKSWYESGIHQSEFEYKIGLKNGKLITYWPNGKRKRKEEYVYTKFISGNCYNEKGKEVDFYPYYQPAKFVGGTDSLYAYIRRNIKQIAADSVKELRGSVLMSFTIEANGAVSDVTVKQSSDKRLNEESIRLIASMPHWLPARLDGDSIKSVAKHVIGFGNNLSMDGKPKIVAEEMPQFEGGERGLMNFISRNIRYPVLAMEQNIQGRVIVRFVVSDTGEVTQVSVLRGIGGGCDEEAMRVVSLMPRWTPGKQDGKPVSVWYTLPIQFKFLGNNVDDPFKSNQNRNFRTF
jgi:TonB family protein